MKDGAIDDVEEAVFVENWLENVDDGLGSTVLEDENALEAVDDGRIVDELGTLEDAKTVGETDGRLAEDD